ncbi:hypothetical protein [Peristeroidobacter agariperforans]|uniref:hypothetical protein n=1 Tax=Peristeroidobacter agariperforans TaxID=268404 RepID=UPI00101CAEDF|nr:hypothetical protein [Peristeroidobacter agariperforans]
MITVPTGVALGELATRLQADDSGAVKREYCDMFNAAQGEARRRLHEPLPAPDFETTAALVTGTQQCTEVIEAVWNALHP